MRSTRGQPEGPDTTLTTRRSLLKASLGAALGAAVASLARPPAADAANGDQVTVGGTHSGTQPTRFNSTSAPNGALAASALDASAITGVAISGVGVTGISNGRAGLHGINTSGEGVGALGASAGAIGVVGWSGDEDLHLRRGQIGVLGHAADDGRGVIGEGEAGIGVEGIVTTGRAVHATATTGTGVHAEATTGFALRTTGRVRLEHSGGKATIAKGALKVTVTPGIDLTPTSAVIATLNGNAGAGRTVRRVSIDTVNNRFTVYLTSTATSAVKVAWIVLS